MSDLKWWTGWTVGLLKRAFAQLDTVEVQLDGGEVGLVLAGDEEPVAPPEPWVALLPGLDPAPMAWKSRAWYLGEHRERLRPWLGDLRVTPRFRTPLERELAR